MQQAATLMSPGSDVDTASSLTSLNTYFPFLQRGRGGEPLDIVKFVKPKNSEHRAKRVLVVDKMLSAHDVVRECLSEDENEKLLYEVWSARDHESARKMITSSSPDLIVVDWDSIVMSAPRALADEQWTFHNSYNVPILLLIEDGLLCSRIISEHFQSGIVDCLRKPLFRTELKTRVKLLLEVNDLVTRLREENMSIKNELNIKHFQLHLELLMHSDSVKDKFLEDVNELSPYLNNEGKVKLKHLTKRFRWALNDENSTSSLRAFDKLNAPLYEQMEKLCMNITRNEKRLCALLLKEQSGSEIAKIMGKTQNCINVAFARLRAKLGVQTNKELKMFVQSICP